MSILTRFTLRSLARNKARTVATVVGIALSCALITAIFTTVTSISGGLLQREMQYDGSWQVTSPRVTDHKLSELRANSHVTELVAGRELGSAKPSDELAKTAGTLVTVKSLPTMLKGAGQATGTKVTDNVGLVQLPAATSGRMPESPNEIALPNKLEGASADGTGLSAEGPLAVGSTVTLELGTRVYTSGDGTRTTLASSDAYASEENGYSEGAEALENARSRTFTVVGFYDSQGGFWGYSGAYASSAAGSVALTGAIPDGSSATDAAGNDLTTDGFAVPYFSTDFKTYRELDDWAALLFSTGVEFQNSGLANGAYTASSVETGGYLLHSNLLRYQGLTDDRAIWNTLWQMAAILTAVVMVASVSLIYTSFAISVTERMRQFGLLSGIGASKRQLRRTVVAEALALGVIGVPVGTAAGIAGTAATLQVTQRGFASILGTKGTLELVVDPRVIGVAVVLSLVTLFISAWIPAARAGRVSAVDAIRQASSVREGRLARLRRRHGAGLGSKLAQLTFGVPGLVAHRNLTRSSSRGRIVVASLAVSVALVVTCGVLDAYMKPVAGLSGSTASQALDADLTANAHADAEATASGEDAFATRFARFTEQASELGGVSAKGHFFAGYAYGIAPKALLNESAVDAMKNVSGFAVAYETSAGNASFSAMGEGSGTDPLSPYASSGDYTGTTNVFYLDDASWAAYVSELGLDAAQFADPAHPRAIGLNLFKNNDGQRYLDLEPFSKPGTITTYALKDAGEVGLDGYTRLGLYEDTDGNPVVRYAKVDEDGYSLKQDNDGTYDLRDIPAGEATTASQELEVTALADRAPDMLLSSGAVGSFPTVILPERALAATRLGSGGTVNVGNGTLFLSADDPDATEESIRGLANALLPSGDGAGSYVYNIAADRQANVDATQLVRLFTLLFSVITMLIALANVFNTLTNSIILRTREFAVLKSVGMGERAFARMIAYECVSYAWRGLAIGLALAMLVSWGMWEAMQRSFVELGFAVPWAYIGVAAAGTLVVLGLSVLYALRRSHAQNLVEALRQDAL